MDIYVMRVLIKLSLILQASWSVGQDRGFVMRDCRCADHRTARPCHSVQLQLLLPSRDRSRGHAESKLQSRDFVSVSPGYIR